jgi:hypothetical protein
MYEIAMSNHYRDAFHEVTEGTNRVTFGPGSPSGAATTGSKIFYRLPATGFAWVESGHGLG